MASVEQTVQSPRRSKRERSEATEKKSPSKRSRTASADPLQNEEGEQKHMYLQHSADGADKFWCITWKGRSYTLHYGKVGSTGVKKPARQMASIQECQDYVDKAIARKKSEGYVERSSPSPSSESQPKESQSSESQSQQNESVVSLLQKIPVECPSGPEA
eukprot:TRINITY_DN3015_c0_g1_i2.p1 TRINITY_DN3015_c0_g1~~TRINITY_DN3015_c0_g1_i2.p1  ORF type:complete len:160 (-),score=19.48 TRINITY_DN3015_c0_g1_i2:2-481(-)